MQHGPSFSSPNGLTAFGGGQYRTKTVAVKTISRELVAHLIPHSLHNMVA